MLNSKRQSKTFKRQNENRKMSGRIPQAPSALPRVPKQTIASYAIYEQENKYVKTNNLKNRFDFINMWCHRESLDLSGPWPMLDEKDLVLKRKIAKGGFGVIFEAEFQGKRVAAKQLPSRKPSFADITLMRHELTLLQYVYDFNVAFV